MCFFVCLFNYNVFVSTSIMTIVPFCDNKYPTVVCDPLWERVQVASDEHDVAFAEIGARSGHVDLLVLKDDMSVTWVFCKGIITMLTTKPSMLPIMLPSSKVASLDRVLSITCTNIVISKRFLRCQQWHQCHHHRLDWTCTSFPTTSLLICPEIFSICSSIFVWYLCCNNWISQRNAKCF